MSVQYTDYVDLLDVILSLKVDQIQNSLLFKQSANAQFIKHG